MGVLFGIVAAVAWGLGDFLITHLTRRLGTTRAMVSIQTLSLIGWVGFLLVQPGVAATGLNVWVIALVAGVCHVAGLLLTYRAFEIGTLSLVSPIASGFAVVTASLALVSGSETPPLLALGGAALLIVGILLATRVQNGATRITLAGVPEAIGSAVAFGTMFWIFDLYVTPSLGVVVPLILLKIMASGAAWVSLAASEAPATQAASIQGGTVALHLSGVRSFFNVRGLELSSWGLALGAASADMLAWWAWLWGIQTEYATIVTAVASLFSVVTILLAWVFLRERLARMQWYGVAIILLGIVLVSL